MSSLEEMEMLIAIVDRGVGEDISEFLRQNQVYLNIIFLGRGTATTQWSDLLGLGDSKKDIIMSIIPTLREDEILQALKQKFRLNEAGTGIAFTADVNSLSSKRLLKYFNGIID